MSRELAKVYTPKKFETKIYSLWEKSGFFSHEVLIKNKIIKSSAKSFSIFMPPPNVTGVLHLGHAMENAIMDTMTRYKRMAGFKTLFLPGADHAAVATQSRVEKNLIKKGIENPRQELGRAGLLKEIKKYADESKAYMIKQIKSLGSSCDWSRFAYTFDQARSQAVNTAFKKMYDDGLIYRGYRVVNWSVKGQSTCSDDEVVHVSRPAKLYTFKYAKDFPLAVATTRPETKLGDTAVAVNPDDPRYKKYIGRTYEVNIGAERPLKLKIIADFKVDPKFGTGAVGVTPAHSQVDFEMYEKNKEIGIIQVIGEDGKMTKAAGKKYAGLTVEAAREKFVFWLRQQCLLISAEDITQNVGTSDRFEDRVEVIPMNQWFVSVSKKIPGRNKSLKDLMREAVISGLNKKSKNKVEIEPERFNKIYLHWIDNLRDWCVSRQIWWGHQIPVWYRGKDVFCGLLAPTGSGWSRDQDTLDTWFSSGLWTFSSLGWPEKTADRKIFHPASWMQMGHELLFFWLARMILMSAYLLDEVPFYKAYIHGILRDKDGRKFSKSLGNGIEPAEVINEYGADALRLTLISDITPGNDSRFYQEKVESNRNFVNKLWNISRFILLSVDQLPPPVFALPAKTLADKWILFRLEETISRVTKDLENYNFSKAADNLKNFTWNDFADWYLETAKIEGGKEKILLFVLVSILKLWHPFIPFVTEAIWQKITGDATPKNFLMVQSWPKGRVVKTTANIKEWELIQELIVKIRNIKSFYHIAPNQLPPLTIVNRTKISLFEKQAANIAKLARVGEIKILSSIEILPQNSLCLSLNTKGMGTTKIYLEVEGIIDIIKEHSRIKKELSDLMSYDAGLEVKLANQQFLERAPAAVIAQEKDKAQVTKNKIKEYQEQLKFF